MDRNQVGIATIDCISRSLSARRAWIEIHHEGDNQHQANVALRKESVDRNQVAVHFVVLSAVALRKESVDRNTSEKEAMEWALVALRKESVDRNYYVCQFACAGRLSLSARRAWIEISNADTKNTSLNVALRKESVDRNIKRRHKKHLT